MAFMIPQPKSNARFHPYLDRLIAMWSFMHATPIRAAMTGFASMLPFIALICLFSTASLWHLKPMLLISSMTALVGGVAASINVLFREDTLKKLFIMACDNSCYLSLKYLLKIGVDINTQLTCDKFKAPFALRGYSAVHIAVLNHDANLLHFLIDNHANIDLQDNHQIFLGSRCHALRSRANNTRCYYTFLYGEANRKSALHLACEQGDIECIQLLVEQNANVHLRDRFAKTAGDLLADDAIVHFYPKESLNSSLRNICAKKLILDKRVVGQNELPVELHEYLKKTRKSIIFNKLFSQKKEPSLAFVCTDVSTRQLTPSTQGKI